MESALYKCILLLSVYKFVKRCQSSIDKQIQTPKCLNVEMTQQSLRKLKLVSINPMLFIMEVGHLSINDVEGINTSLFTHQKDKLLTFAILGYTLHSSNHFYLRLVIMNGFNTME